MSEYIEILNEAGEVTGSMSREEAEEQNHITHAAFVFIFTPSGEVWIQKRAQNKKHFPGLWDISAAGGIPVGEDPAVAARCELEEEASLHCSLYEVETFLNSFLGQDGKNWKRMGHLYIGITTEKPTGNEEVEEFRKLPYPEMRKWAEEKPAEFVPSFLLELDKAVTAYQTMIS